MVRLTADQGVVVLGLIQQTGDVGLIEGVGRMIQDQLSNPNHDSDIIDTMGRMLGPSRGRTRFTDEKLEMLRTAIYSPRELEKLRNAVEKRQCDGCRIELRDELIISAQNGGFFCVACSIPTFSTCIGCHRPVEVYDAMRRLVNNTYKKTCEHCNGLAAPTTREQFPVVTPPQPPTPSPTGRTVSQLEADRARRFWRSIRDEAPGSAPTPAPTVTPATPATNTVAPFEWRWLDGDVSTGRVGDSGNIVIQTQPANPAGGTPAAGGDDADQ